VLISARQLRGEPEGAVMRTRINSCLAWSSLSLLR
jgi:hypothetical protein